LKQIGSKIFYKGSRKIIISQHSVALPCEGTKKVFLVIYLAIMILQRMKIRNIMQKKLR